MGKISDYWPINRCISVTVQDRAYEGHPKSFRPRHIRQQYFLQSIHQWNVLPLRTIMSRLLIWRHC